MTKVALLKLKKLHEDMRKQTINNDQEQAHHNADLLLCDALELLKTPETAETIDAIIATYGIVEKWYA